MNQHDKNFKEKIIETVEYENFRTEKSCEISFYVCIIGVVFGISGILIDTFLFFLIGLGLCEFFIFLSITPSSIGMMTCISKNLRGQCNAVSLFAGFALGGFPAPTIIGIIFEMTSLHIGMLAAASMLIFSALFWFFAWLISRQHAGPYQYKWRLCSKKFEKNPNLQTLLEIATYKSNEKDRN